MTVQDVLNRINELKPNKFSAAAVFGWISKVDFIISEQHLPYGGEAIEEPYSPETADEEVLLSEEWQDIYLYYASAQMDYLNGEAGRYTNSMIMYNTELQSYLDWYNRTHAHIATRLKTSVDGI